MEPAGSGGSLASALFGALSLKAELQPVWAEIRFDSPPSYLEPRRGEAVLECLPEVEDTKGNNGVPGELTLTNLRLVWVNRKARRTNISVGYSCIASLSVMPASSRFRGNCSSLHIMTRQGQQRFEFIFTAVSESGANLPATARAVLAAFDASKPCREMRLRGALFLDDELRLLPREVAYSRVNSVWNLSSEAGSLGAFVITNLRLVWSSRAAEAFNVSIPYLQIRAVKVCTSSKHGVALVVETQPGAGGHVLGFKLEPRETLDYIHKELTSLMQAFMPDPIFGVEYDSSAGIDVAAMQNEATSDDAEGDVVDGGFSTADAWVRRHYAAADGGGASQGEPVFCAELGLAIEPPQDGASIAALWSIL